jgi:DNA-binding SARP family transcriptional activator/basic membrane lipoprotein Med (substrate-binding protein (PBP1-ABC) superfamily)
VTKPEVFELRVLGPLEARLGGESIELGGAKQRAVLATLLLRPSEVVSTERLVDEIWGEAPPASADHSLEVYISRLRQLFNGHGPSLARRGAGYVLDPGETTLDSRVFSELAADAAREAAASDSERAFQLALEAIALWRGPALADLALGPSSRAEAERLEELRLRTLEVRFDAELALGRHLEVVGELQALVGQNPYRERFVAQLMLALYRSGRHAEALESYEQMRRRLDADLGLQPSIELQQLSGQIVRQEPELSRPELAATAATRPTRRRTRRLSGLVLAGAVAAAGAMALSASGSAPQPSQALGSLPGSVALVVPAWPAARAFGAEEPEGNDRVALTAWGFNDAASNHGLDPEILVVEDVDTDVGDVERLFRQIGAGRYELVILPGDGAAARLIAPRLGTFPATRFVFLDTSLTDLLLDGTSNATAVTFALEASSLLAGALSSSVSPRGAVAGQRPDRVSVIAGMPTSETKRAIEGFQRGARRASSSVIVDVEYSHEMTDPTACERIANEQIDAGSDVLFVVAGRCGLGASAVAKARGVWVVGEGEFDLCGPPNHLGCMFKDWKRGPRDTLNAFVAGELPAGSDIVLDLDDDYAVGTWMSNSVPPAIASRVISLCSRIRKELEVAGT